MRCSLCDAKHRMIAIILCKGLPRECLGLEQTDVISLCSVAPTYTGMHFGRLFNSRAPTHCLPHIHTGLVDNVLYISAPEMLRHNPFGKALRGSIPFLSTPAKDDRGAWTAERHLPAILSPLADITACRLLWQLHDPTILPIWWHALLPPNRLRPTGTIRTMPQMMNQAAHSATIAPQPVPIETS